MTTIKASSVHTSRLQIIRHQTEMTKNELKVLSTMDLDDYSVEKILAHEEKDKHSKNWMFKAQWVRYEPEEDSEVVG